MKRRSFMVQGLCLGMLLTGMNACFYHSFFPYTNYYKFTIALFLAAMWFTVLTVSPFRMVEEKVRKKLRISFLRNPVSLLLLLLTLAGMAAHVLQNIVRYQKDAVILFQAILHRYDIYYGNTQQVFFRNSYQSKGAWLLFLIEMILALWMAKAFSTRKSMSWGMLPVVAVVSGGLLLGEAPEMLDMVCIASGTLGIRFVLSERKVGGRKHFRQITRGSRRQVDMYSLLIIISILVFSVAGRVSLTTSHFFFQKEEKVLALQHKWEDEAIENTVRTLQRLQTMTGKETLGLLTNVAPVYTGANVLTVTVKGKPTTGMYLRGFIGNQYQDGQWTNHEKTEVNAFGNKNFLQGYDLMNLYWKEISDSSKSMKMKVQYAEGNRSKYAYIPYYSKLTQDSAKRLSLHRDLELLRGKSVQEYELFFQPNISTMDLEMNTSLLKSWMKSNYSERSYLYYVIDQNTELPKKGLDRTRKLAIMLLGKQMDSEEDGEIYNSISASMRQYFRKTTKYSLKLEKKPSNQDYVEHFLFTQKKGFCEHYATAGAILFRAMGVPARYATGYKVSQEEFKPNGDGTYTAKVIDSSAHAWTEVFVTELGWVSADMTPSDDSTDQARLEGNTDSSDFDELQLDTTKQPLEEDASQEEMNQEEKNQDEKNALLEDAKKLEEEKMAKDNLKQGEISSSSETFYPILWWIFRVAIGIGILLLIWYGQRILRYRKLKRCQNNRDYLLESNRLFEHYLHCCGISSLSRKKDSEYLQKLKKIYPANSRQGELERYYQVLEAARFAKEDRTREETLWGKEVVLDLAKDMIQRKGIGRRFYVRGIRNWRY